MITDELWAKVHAALNGRTGIPRIRGVKADVLAGLFYCSCGEKMQRKAPWKRGYSRYYCLGQIAGKSECRAIGEAAIIEHGFSFLGTLENGQFQETDALRLAGRRLTTPRPSWRNSMSAPRGTWMPSSKAMGRAAV